MIKNFLRSLVFLYVFYAILAAQFPQNPTKYRDKKSLLSAFNNEIIPTIIIFRSNPDKCVYEGESYDPGTYDLKNQCSRIICGEDGTIQIQT